MRNCTVEINTPKGEFEGMIGSLFEVVSYSSVGFWQSLSVEFKLSRKSPDSTHPGLNGNPFHSQSTTVLIRCSCTYSGLNILYKSS